MEGKEKFTELVLEGVKKEFEGEGAVSLATVRKNNGVKRTGILLRENGKELAPLVYLDSYYEMYQCGAVTLDDVQDDICGLLEEHRDCGGMVLGDLACYSRVREKIICYLVNREYNRELLEKIPHIPYLDMEIVFAVLLGRGTIGEMTLPVPNQLSGKWPGDTRKLFSQAVRNIQRLYPARVQPLHEAVDALAEICPGGEGIKKLTDILQPGKMPPMYVLSNQAGIHGAAVLLYPGILEKLAGSLESDLVILPSSIHEVILVPLEKEIGTGELREMVRRINETCLPPEDRLSDQVYIYHRKEGRIRIAE